MECFPDDGSWHLVHGQVTFFYPTPSCGRNSLNSYYLASARVRLRPSVNHECVF